MLLDIKLRKVIRPVIFYIFVVTNMTLGQKYFEI
jgi:hypothetical protein